MKLTLVAVGQRLPAWAETACGDYLGRLPNDWRVTLKAIKAEPRTQGLTVDALKAAEARRIEAAIPKGARRVVLDERGARLTTLHFAERLQAWQRDGRDVALLIGGPDGLDAALAAAADDAIRLSDLTLPHALARVLLAEALYRSWSVLAGHPYHRE
ncbi:MAG TPA: 23S rRNA (pseudouridine(1915)-N(3))-methyltransferase RlmH [Methylibium sp.]|uniref:23S rRNA (pseudouridine(1915)-N(3))-methyltransferase RlmH n=1 Tax=Methylibium sp. TaxID=2067992 RepID=UPI002DB632E6|nr:23S rRNA (pseudouridine(1915)-N(3))-methyltransferase RlmH [Methylibium sp.]HEU4458427.1 23S rRNA (pseudouridine(1915)-N(3))-methyltransferase RlmH [Methylibium sp.]